MGGIFSKSSFLSDPTLYATQVSTPNGGEDDSELKWKEYDYIVVGGGVSVLHIPYISFTMLHQILVSTSSQVRLDASLPPDCLRIATPRSS